MTQAAAGRPSDSGDTGDTGNIADASVIDADAVAAALRVNVETGPSAQEAASRLANSGPNELRLAPRAPAWRRVLAQFQDPLIYLLLPAVVVALSPGGSKTRVRVRVPRRRVHRCQQLAQQRVPVQVVREPQLH